MSDDAIAQADKAIADLDEAVWRQPAEDADAAVIRWAIKTRALVPELRDEVIRLRADVERLTEQLIDARIEMVRAQSAEWAGDYVNGTLYEHVGIAEAEYPVYTADPRGFMRQKITEEQQ